MRVHICLWSAALMTLAFAVCPAKAQTLFKPVAVVNESVITGFDLAQRARLLSLMAGQGREPTRYRQQALEGLILDKLKIQAGKAIGLDANDEVARIGFNLFSEQNNREPRAFRRELNEVGISNQAINDFVQAETIWSEVVRTRFLSRAEPSPTRIEEELRQNLGIINSSYRLKELGLRLTGDSEADAQKREQIERIHADLQNGVDFDQAVQEFSETPTAAHGGDLGWLEGKQLPTDVVNNLNSLEDGQFTRPFSTPNSIVILQLVERRRESGTDNSRGAEEIRERIRQNLLSEEISRLADGYLQEIRRDALIELQ